LHLITVGKTKGEQIQNIHLLPLRILERPSEMHTECGVRFMASAHPWEKGWRQLSKQNL